MAKYQFFFKPDSTPFQKLRSPKYTAFGRKNREVELYGEAYFRVSNNPNKPFIVHVKDIRTEVLGTSFKINGHNNEPLRVAVETGKVRVDRWSDGQIVQQLAVLNPGDRPGDLLRRTSAQRSPEQ